MKVGDLVKMIDDPHNIVGIITELIGDTYRNDKVYYKVGWLDDIRSEEIEDVLEVLSESR